MVSQPHRCRECGEGGGRSVDSRLTVGVRAPTNERTARGGADPQLVGCPARKPEPRVTGQDTTAECQILHRCREDAIPVARLCIQPAGLGYRCLVSAHAEGVQLRILGPDPARMGRNDVFGRTPSGAKRCRYFQRRRAEFIHARDGIEVL